MQRRKRVLFFAEAVTLAHVARPIALAKGLDAGRFEVFMACDSRYGRFLDCEPWQTLPLQSISSRQFLQALADGSPVYDVPTLRRYVKDDLELIRRVEPDLIVGDFRLSLSVSARLAGVPYAAITNAYWSPHYSVREFPMPVLPLTKFLPVPFARKLFRIGQPLAFRLHCRPLNRVRQEHGLPSLGSDLRRVYTDADHVLYGDVPAMFPIENLPTSHRFVGPILWSPSFEPPDWWDDLPIDKPIVYLTLGSSGSSKLMETALRSLANLPVTVIASAAGAGLAHPPPANAWVADFLPGIEAAARSRLVICNGGSPTTQQALAAGVPVLGIAGNMDQFLNMQAVEAASAGKVLRADRLGEDGLREMVKTALDSPQLSHAARVLANNLVAYNAPTRFSKFAADLTNH